MALDAGPALGERDAELSIALDRALSELAAKP